MASRVFSAFSFFSLAGCDAGLSPFDGVSGDASGDAPGDAPGEELEGAGATDWVQGGISNMTILLVDISPTANLKPSSEMDKEFPNCPLF
jgi:hypothetical protein